MKKFLRIFLFIILLTQFSSCQKEKTITSEVFLQNVFETQSILTKSLSADILINDRCKDLANKLEYWLYNENKSHNNICALKFHKKYEKQWGYWEIQATWENNKWGNFDYTSCGKGFILERFVFSRKPGKCYNVQNTIILNSNNMPSVMYNFVDISNSDLSETAIKQLVVPNETKTLRAEFLPFNLEILYMNSRVDISAIDFSRTKISELYLNKTPQKLKAEFLPLNLNVLHGTVSEFDLSKTKITKLNLTMNKATKSLKSEFLPSNLETLDISNSNIDISDIDLSKTKISKIFFNKNNGTKILKGEFLPSNLETLDISNSNIDVFNSDLSETAIKQLVVPNETKILRAEFLPSNLETLDISLSNIDVSEIDLSKTKITKLNLTMNKATKSLKSEFLPSNLETLDISNSNIDISDIDLSKTKITKLNLNMNKATKSLKSEFLPSNLETLDISLSNINVSEIDLSKTKITKLNLMGNIATRQFRQKFLPPNLEILDLSYNSIDITEETWWVEGSNDYSTGSAGYPAVKYIDLSKSKITQLFLMGNTGTSSLDYSLEFKLLPSNLQKIYLNDSHILKNNSKIKKEIENYYQSQGKEIEVILNRFYNLEFLTN